MNNELKNTLYDVLRQSGKALSSFDLADQLSAGMEFVQPALNELCAEGKAAITKKGKYACPELLDLIPARAGSLRSGAPTALPFSGDPAMKIRKTRLRPLPDDILYVRDVGAGECELTSIQSRTMRELAAFVRVEQREIRSPRGKHKSRRPEPMERQRILTGIPCDRRIPYLIEIADDEFVKNDTIALLEIDRYPEGDAPMYAHVVRVLGRASDMHARLKVIAETHAFPTEFPEEVEQQCRALQQDQIPENDREDRRDLMTFTIDGPFSKDLDDAVSLERLENGDWQLGVHIADVSHYVRTGSPIDREALERGTSLYLPGLTVPMLPEILSNDLCSLMPGVDRLALSCYMIVRGGKIIDHHLCRSVIHSHARLTYDAVNRFYDGDDDAIDPALQQTLRDMLALSHAMRKRRFAAGCIELDLPETEFVLNEENVPTDILCAVRGESERLIEDFMLAANETVAALAKATSTPLIYRVHEDPDADKLAALEKFLCNQNIRVHLGASPHPGLLQKIIEETADHPGRDTIRKMLLRSLQRAEYSEKPLGHYALALEDYCHFTSPIRRYPDLVVHRMIKQLIDGNVSSSHARMSELARQSSAREQEATLAEREADDLLKARYMKDRIGRKYNGVVSGVTGWGLYVTLDNTVEGLVHIASLDDYYDFDRERGQLIGIASRNVFSMGDKVRVRVDGVDIDRAEINFTLAPYR